MTKKCIFCSSELPHSVIEICRICGEKVWGEKMFNTIIKNMEEARDKGDLCHTNLQSTPIETSNKLEGFEEFR
jgi:hypothetical protein